jgi:cation:H+ antiporter
MYQILTNYFGSFQTELPSLFVGILIISMVVGFYLLTKGGDLLSDHCSNLAKAIGIPSVVVGLTVVSIATSAPELFTSIAAVTSGAKGLILGNIIGSNIANIGLILGISLLIKPINTQNAVSSVQCIILIALSSVFVVYLIIHPLRSLDWVAGVALLIFIFLYLIFLTVNALKNRRSKILVPPEISEESSTPIYVSCLMVLLATIALWAGSDSLVFGAKNLASIIGVPEELIGFTLVAIGTSLPELAASVSLTKKGEFAMLLGNIVGSNIFNISLVGGVAGVLGPITVSTKFAWIDYLSLLILTTLLAYWIKGKNLEIVHGILLIGLYLAATTATWVFNS